MSNPYEFFNYLEQLQPSIRLDAGQPEIPVRGEIIQAAVDSLLKGETGYASTRGLQELREAIAEVEKVTPQEVIVAPGAKFLIVAEIARAEKIAVISPHWSAYTLMVKEMGKKLRVIRTTYQSRWTPDLADLRDLDASLLILNYPNNPTGRVLPPRELQRLIDIVESRGIKIVSDEVYGDISFVDFQSPREIYENVVTVKSFSKLYSMTGFRLGYAIASPEEIEKIRSFLEATVTSVPIFVQRAGIRAIEMKDEIAKEIKKEYRRRTMKAKSILRGLKFHAPEGAFYIFLKIPMDGFAFSRKLLKRDVAVFPGSMFGNYPDFIRISLAGMGWERGLHIIKEEVQCALQ